MDQVRAAAGKDAPAPSAAMDRVLQDSSLYLLGNVASRVIGFLAIPFYSRFLTPAQYGLIELIELSTQTIAIAFGLQAIGAALSRLFYDQKTPEAERAVVSTSLIGTAMLSALVTVVAVAGAGPLSRLVFHSEEWVTLLQAAFIAMFFGNMIEVVLVYERIRDNARFFLAYTLVTLAATLGLNIVFIGFLHAGVWGFVSSKLVVSVLSCGYLALRMRRDVGWHWRSLYVPELVRFGAPLVLSSLSYFAIHFSSRFFLSASVSLDELGRYALSYRFAILVSALVGDSFSKSWGVTLYRYLDRPDWRAQFARVASYFTFILFVTGLAIALFSPELLRVMVPKEYFPPPLLLPIIIASYLAREIGDFFRSLMLINKRSGQVGQIALGGAVLNLIANAALIPTFGIYGAAAATFVTWFAYMIVCWLVANREHRLPVSPLAYVRLSALVVAIYAIAANTRVQPLLAQTMFDTVWVLIFAGAAIAFFLTPVERRGALDLLGDCLLWLVSRGSPGPLRPAGPAGPPRLLVLSYYYPPQNEIGAARPFRFAKYLRRMGMPVHVVTAAEAPAGLAGDEAQDVTRAPAVQLGEGPDGDRAPWPLRAATTALHLAERALLPYDDRLNWVPVAFQAAAVRLEPGTVLLSTHPPTVAHVTALALKGRYGVPWIADFRDPLWGNPYRTSQRAAVLDPLLERMTVASADAVIANTEASAAVLRGRYPGQEDKIHVIWNGFDPEDGLGLVPPPPKTRRIIAHVGTLYGNRTPLPFLLCLERLIESGALAPETIRFRQVGRADPSCLSIADPVVTAIMARGCCETVDRNVPRAEAWAAMLEADWLLLLDMNLVNAGLQVPAKTYEYVRTGRPILALTVPGSSTERVLAIAGVPHACVDLGLEPEAFDAAVLEFLRRPAAVVAPSAAFRATFEAPSQVRQLEQIVAGVLARHAGPEAAAGAAVPPEGAGPAPGTAALA